MSILRRIKVVMSLPDIVGATPIYRPVRFLLGCRLVVWMMQDVECHCPRHNGLYAHRVKRGGIMLSGAVLGARKKFRARGGFSSTRHNKKQKLNITERSRGMKYLQLVNV